MKTGVAKCLSVAAFTIAKEERMERVRKLFLVLGTAIYLVIGTRIIPASAQQIDRTQFPIPDTQYKRDAKFPPIKPVLIQNLNPDVLMMQPAEDWYRYNAAELLGPPKIWSILVQ